MVDNCYNIKFVFILLKLQNVNFFTIYYIRYSFLLLCFINYTFLFNYILNEDFHSFLKEIIIIIYLWVGTLPIRLPCPKRIV